MWHCLNNDSALLLMSGLCWFSGVRFVLLKVLLGSNRRKRGEKSSLVFFTVLLSPVLSIFKFALPPEKDNGLLVCKPEGNRMTDQYL